jgi:hypothetical protein
MKMYGWARLNISDCAMNLNDVHIIQGRRGGRMVWFYILNHRTT